MKENVPLWSPRLRLTERALPSPCSPSHIGFYFARMVVHTTLYSAPSQGMIDSFHHAIMNTTLLNQISIREY